MTGTDGEVRLELGVLFLSGQSVDPVESLGKLGSASRSLVSLLTGDGDDTSDPLGDRRFLGDDKVLDLVGLADVTEQQHRSVRNSRASPRRSRHSRSSTELDTGRFPLGVLNVRGDLVQRKLEGDDPDRIRVGFSKDGPETGNVLSDLERKLFRVDLDGLFHPFVGHGLDLFQVGR